MQSPYLGQRGLGEKRKDAQQGKKELKSSIRGGGETGVSEFTSSQGDGELG